MIVGERCKKKIDIVNDTAEVRYDRAICSALFAL